MGRTDYKELVLRIESIQDGKLYKVRASSNCAGDANVNFSLDALQPPAASDEPEADDRQAILLSSAGPSLVHRPILLHTRAPSIVRARAFGQQLFKAIFQGPVGIALDRCRQESATDNIPLRLRLNLTDVPELAGLPWEFLNSVPHNTFLARSYDSIVRYLELEDAYEESLLTEPPLRILVAISNPRDVTQLDVDGEFNKLQEVINQLQSRHQIILDPLYKPTIRALRKRLYEHRLSDPYHIFHFIGHGAFDPLTTEGRLVLENESGGACPISGQELAEVLALHHSLRLAIINACEGARISPTDSYSGIAQTLLRSGAAPAVIAMQYVISDAAAKIFAQNFYEALLKGESIDMAVSLARMAISDAEQSETERGPGDPIEWGTPVLYMRARDSRIVDFPQPSAAEMSEPAVAPQPPQSARLAGHYEAVVKALHEGQLVPFLGLDSNLFDQTTTARPPGYAELVARLADFSGYPYTAGAPLAGVSQYAQMPNRLSELYDEVAPLFNDKKYKPTLLHRLWADIAKEQSALTDLDPKRKRFLVVTTSYDYLLEQAFAETVGRFHVFSYIADGSELERGKFFRQFYDGGTAQYPALVDVHNKELSDELPVILKLPGTIEPFNARIRFAITEDQYFDLLTNRELTSLLPSQVMTKLRGSHHLFLGCNLRDWNWRGLLYRIWERQSPPYDSWAVQSDLQAFERKYWEASRVEIIDENLVDYITRLKTRLSR